ncbi:MAG TPA: hypothetical protein VEY87_00390 [Gaiellaceae bacterium]|nr:hypothetical protein [Gaiellaceae bacterium]
MLWELLFMLVVLKIPVFYLCGIVWWAIRAEPRPLEGAVAVVPEEAPPGCDWRSRSRRRRPRPRGGNGRGRGRPVGARRVAAAGARAQRVAE